ncbi:MAG: hypothetical protein QXO16_04080 [Archaeoglobaceae archaeon]
MGRYLAIMCLGILAVVALITPATARCITTVEIKAEEMRFNLPIETDNIAEYLKSLLKVVGDLLQGEIVAENVVMKNAEIKRLVTIKASEITTPRAEMKISLLSILGETITSLDQLLKLITGKEVVWRNVYICASEMKTGGMSFKGLQVWR